ncbi:hypothetical protein ACWDRB_47645 [Nonomuraea sp. NPDC003707]
MRVAGLVSNLFHPSLLAGVLPPLVGAHAEGLTGAAWGMVTAVTAGVIPYVDGRRLGSAQGSKGLRQLLGAFLSLLSGLVVTVAVGAAPRAVVGVHAALLALLMVIALITALAKINEWAGWNISIHAATASGCAVIGFIETGSRPGLGVGLGLLAAAVAWSRVCLNEHTPRESVAGLVAGGAACWIVYTTIT